MFRKNLFFLLCFISVIVFAQQNQKPVDLKIKEDFIHQWTKTVFPKLWAGFQRETVRSYDSKNKNIGISYVQKLSKKNKTVLTIYIYPKSEINNQSLRDEFLSYLVAINKNSQSYVEMKPLFGKLSNDKLNVHYIYSLFKNSMVEADFFNGVRPVEKNSLLAIYESGGWTFKIRISSDEMTNEQLTDLKQKTENYFSVLDIAATKTLPTNDSPDVLLSPVVKRDSMMAKATIAATEAKIEWLKNNSDIKDIMTGFNDMKIESEIYATEKMLQFFKTNNNNWKMTPETQKYFDDMILISDNKQIKNYIYNKHMGVIDYPEGEIHKKSYAQFKTDHKISKELDEIYFKLFYNLD